MQLFSDFCFLSFNILVLTHFPTLTLYTRTLTPYPPFCVLIIRHIFRRKLFCLLFLLFPLLFPSHLPRPTSNLSLPTFYFSFFTSYFSLSAFRSSLPTTYFPPHIFNFPLLTSRLSPLTSHPSPPYPIPPYPIPHTPHSQYSLPLHSFIISIRSSVTYLVSLFSAGWLCGTYTLIRSYNKKMQSYIKIDCIF